MPRKARIDASGALHHIIVRGIERRKIFYDDKDRNNLIKGAEKKLERKYKFEAQGYDFDWVVRHEGKGGRGKGGRA